jgi:predicted phage terminase large subunit-like protein
MGVIEAIAPIYSGEMSIGYLMFGQIATENKEEIRLNANGQYNNIIVEENACVDGGKLFSKVNQYDEYERSGAQVAISEYSVDTTVGDTLTKNNIWSAIENAAFLTGVEKNADLVRMISYETPLAKINAQTKDTSLLWFDSHNLVLTPDYYTQMLFANNMGTNYISLDDGFNEEGIYRSVTVDINEKVIYVTDVVFTRLGMEVTESAVAAMLSRNQTRKAWIESNNGGRGFARSVQALAPECDVEWFFQSANKESRILTNSSSVLKHIRMPQDWAVRWSEFYQELTLYRRSFRANRNHDAADVLTGIIEREVFSAKRSTFGAVGFTR